MTSTENPNNSKVFQNHDDVHISFEDQQKINQFAKHNARMDELKIELETKRAFLKNIEEAYEELELLDDEDGTIPFQFGEVFRSLKVEETQDDELSEITLHLQEMLTDLKNKTKEQISRIDGKVHTIKTEMNDLKAQLYQRFGSNISLESEES